MAATLLTGHEDFLPLMKAFQEESALFTDTDRGLANEYAQVIINIIILIIWKHHVLLNVVLRERSEVCPCLMSETHVCFPCHDASLFISPLGISPRV